MSSIHRTDIRATILSIVWAAGPVTIIAITLGYYLSHGTHVPLVTVAYFSFFYVFFVGLVGFVSKLVFDSLKNRKQEQMEEKFLSVIDESYNNLYLVKKLNLSNLTDQLRDNEWHMRYCQSLTQQAKRSFIYLSSISIKKWPSLQRLFIYIEKMVFP